MNYITENNLRAIHRVNVASVTNAEYFTCSNNRLVSMLIVPSLRLFLRAIQCSVYHKC